jgi:DNA (cytosine-5)-methyltransferase 1
MINDTSGTNESTNSEANKSGCIAYIQLEIHYEDNSTRVINTKNLSDSDEAFRQRLYWAADSNKQRQQGSWEMGQSSDSTTCSNREINRTIDASDSSEWGATIRMEDTGCGEQQERGNSNALFNGEPGQKGATGKIGRRGSTDCGGSMVSSRLGNAEHDGHATTTQPSSNVQPSEERRKDGQDISGESEGASGRESGADLPRCTDGRTEWHNPDWIYCRDNKYRPIKPSIKPLVDGVSERVVRSGDSSTSIDADNTQEARLMRLKAYGNAIIPQVAAAFICAFMDAS